MDEETKAKVNLFLEKMRELDYFKEMLKDVTANNCTFTEDGNVEITPIHKAPDQPFSEKAYDTMWELWRDCGLNIEIDFIDIVVIK